MTSNAKGKNLIVEKVNKQAMQKPPTKKSLNEPKKMISKELSKPVKQQ